MCPQQLPTQTHSPLSPHSLSLSLSLSHTVSSAHLWRAVDLQLMVSLLGGEDKATGLPGEASLQRRLPHVQHLYLRLQDGDCVARRVAASKSVLEIEAAVAGVLVRRARGGYDGASVVTALSPLEDVPPRLARDGLLSAGGEIRRGVEPAIGNTSTGQIHHFVHKVSRKLGRKHRLRNLHAAAVFGL